LKGDSEKIKAEAEESKKMIASLRQHLDSRIADLAAADFQMQKKNTEMEQAASVVRKLPFTYPIFFISD
jgi:hypothetical protein